MLASPESTAAVKPAIEEAFEPAAHGVKRAVRHERRAREHAHDQVIAERVEMAGRVEPPRAPQHGMSSDPGQLEVFWSTLGARIIPFSMSFAKRAAVMANKRRATALGRAESLLESDDYAGAASAAEAALGGRRALPRRRGPQALALSLLHQIQRPRGRREPGRVPQAMRLFALALRLDPANAEAKSEIEELQSVLEARPREVHPPHPEPLDVTAVVGAVPRASGSRSC